MHTVWQRAGATRTGVPIFRPPFERPERIWIEIRKELQLSSAQRGTSDNFPQAGPGGKPISP